ncbi:MAG: hypothetical protein COX17_05180 [Deltaproteobacteria bacterium CG23_combo_of_CG06-09_8_20_14_all_60_8]|nr:MAG: hypothetical protein AUK28_05590 [Desulfobacterales bacterium CG2_30_60_27]PIP43758.1 MAG: hypothetical protein COX17_05180 [Deltaproteobacteria bacterium CG23_combo_of_CG06-09_8_20_14_all_60_8]
MRQTPGKILALLVLATLYLLVNIDLTDYTHWAPELLAEKFDQGKTWTSNILLYRFTHLLQLIPLTGGATFLAVSLMRDKKSDWPQWDQMLRIYFTIGILLGLLFGLYYFSLHP